MKFFKGLLIFVIVIVVIGALIIGAALVVTSLPTKSVDVEWTEADFQSYIDKGGINFTENHASAEDMIAGNFITKGQIAVDATVSNEELTAAANNAMNDNSIMSDIKIKCNDDGTMDATCVVGDLSPIIAQFPELEKYEGVLKLVKNKTVYMNSSLYYDESTGLFGGTTNELRIGLIKIPVNTVEDGLRDGCSSLQNAVQGMDGFSVNSFEISSEGFDFDGTIPETIESAGELAGF